MAAANPLGPVPTIIASYDMLDSLDPGYRDLIVHMAKNCMPGERVQQVLFFFNQAAPHNPLDAAASTPFSETLSDLDVKVKAWPKLADGEIAQSATRANLGG